LTRVKRLGPFFYWNFLPAPRGEPRRTVATVYFALDFLLIDFWLGPCKTSASR